MSFVVRIPFTLQNFSVKFRGRCNSIKEEVGGLELTVRAVQVAAHRPTPVRISGETEDQATRAVEFPPVILDIADPYPGARFDGPRPFDAELFVRLPINPLALGAAVGRDATFAAPLDDSIVTLRARACR